MGAQNGMAIPAESQDQLVAVEKLLVDVGPEFLEDVAHTIVQQRTRPALKSVSRAAAFLARIVTS